jgi:hypothetical protein
MSLTDRTVPVSDRADISLSLTELSLYLLELSMHLQICPCICCSCPHVRSGGHRYVEMLYRYFESANFKALALLTIFKALPYAEKILKHQHFKKKKLTALKRQFFLYSNTLKEQCHKIFIYFCQATSLGPVDTPIKVPGSNPCSPGFESSAVPGSNPCSPGFESLQSRVRIRRLPSPQLIAHLLVGCHLGWHLAAG